ncbi:unnamed protein product, partial [Amoebophrya sp. A120]
EDDGSIGLDIRWSLHLLPKKDAKLRQLLLDLNNYRKTAEEHLSRKVYTKSISHGKRNGAKTSMKAVKASTAVKKSPSEVPKTEGKPT